MHVKAFAGLSVFLPCLCQRLFFAKGLKLSKRRVTCRNTDLR